MLANLHLIFILHPTHHSTNYRLPMYSVKKKSMCTHNERLTYRNGINVRYGLHLLNVAQSHFRNPQRTAQVGPVCVARPDSFESTPSVGTEHTLGIFLTRHTGFAQPISPGDSLNTIASLMGMYDVYGYVRCVGYGYV